MTMTSSSSSSPEIQGVQVQDRFSYKLATHDEVLDDLSRCVHVSISLPYVTLQNCSRFILNLPDDELSSLERICFQVEQAYVLSYPLSGMPFNVTQVIGITKISFAKKIQSSPRFLSRDSLRCSSKHALCYNIGVTIMNWPTPISCNTRLGCLYVVQLC